MIIGKNSIWKMLVLFVIVLVAVLDLIFCTKSVIVEWINGILIFLELGWLTYNLYVKWSKESLNDKAYKNK